MSVTIASGGRASAAASPASPSGAVATSNSAERTSRDEAAHLRVVLHDQHARPPGPARREDVGRRARRSSSTTPAGRTRRRPRPRPAAAGAPGGGRGGSSIGEQRAALRRVAELDPPAVQLHELLRDREAEPRAADPPRRLVLAAREPGEHRLALRRGRRPGRCPRPRSRSPRRRPRPRGASGASEHRTRPPRA